jgi:hypothetical protein
LIVFQFKTFVSTPELDAEVIRQTRGYNADLLVLETGIWGFVPKLGSAEHQSRTFLKTMQDGFKASNIIIITDGFHQGMIGPHVVNGSIAASALKTASLDLGCITFDRTKLLHDANSIPLLADSMAKHGYAGLVSNLHALMLFSFICAK